MPEVTAGLRERLEAAVEQLRETGAVYAIEDAEIRRIADAVLPVLLTELGAEQAKLRDLLRAESARANAAIDREETAEKAIAELQADRDRLAAEVAELRQIVEAPVSAAGGPEFGRALVGKVRELVDERRHYAIAAEAVGRVRAVLAEGQASGWTGCRYHQAISAALDGSGEAS